MEENKKNSNGINEIKIILLGEAGVGKTSIILRYYKNKFETNTITTIGSTFVIKELQRGNTTYRLNIWDTSGQEKYRSFTKLFVQGAKIIILVYAVDNKESFNILDFWYKSVLEISEGEENIVLAIIGNKIDKFDEAVITEDEGKKFADGKNAIFRLVSAKEDPKGLSSLFDTLLDELIKKNPNLKIGENNIKINNVNNSKKNKKKGGCC